MRPSASTVMTLSAMASSVTIARGRNGTATAPFCGSISSAVSSSAASPALSITVLDSSTRGRGLALQPPPQVALHQLDIFRRDELAQRPADDFRGAQIEQRQETRVGE